MKRVDALESVADSNSLVNRLITEDSIMNRPAIMVTLAALLVVLCGDVRAQDQHKLLYSAIVAVDGAKVHSGPGKTHYATHHLDQNEIVQVYREDPGGWCLIRPPAKSFSLIPASAVTMLSDEVAQIKVDAIDAWVGTALGPVDRPMSQKSLSKGERVAVLDEVRWPNPGGKPIVWLQIEPPAGEYRWIRSTDLQVPPDEDEATRQTPRRKIDYSIPPSFGDQDKPRKRKMTRQGPSATRQASSSTTSIKPKQRFAEAESSGWKSATRPIPKVEQERPQYTGTFGSPIPSDDLQAGYIEQATFLVDQEPADSRFERWNGNTISDLVPPTNDRFASLDSMERQTRSFVRERNEPVVKRNTVNVRENSTLMRIEETLSKEILKDPHNWNLADLKFETERAKAKSSDPVERLALQHVLDKLARCDKLCKDYRQASPLSASHARATQPQARQANSPYDATGWLKRLANSTGSIDPRYVLQDSLGRVTHEIKGMAGMNLAAYVDKPVGIIGRHGFNYRLNLSQVTANRVIVIR